MYIRVTDIDDLHALENVRFGEPVLVEFEPKVYNDVPTIELPRTGTLVIFNGNGASINFQKTAEGFTSIPETQGQALNEWNTTRFLFKDFTCIQGGKKGISIGSTYNTIIENIEFVGQREYAIELRFALKSVIRDCLVTVPFKDGVYVGGGNWSGANQANSQSNSTTVQGVRVFAWRESGNSFIFEDVNGCSLKDCISEGHQNERAVLIDNGTNSVTKNFHLDNFHLEHEPKECAIEITSGASVSNVIQRLYVNLPTNVSSPIIKNRLNAPMDLRDIGWWHDNYKILFTHNAPRLETDRCHYKLGKKTLQTEDPRGLFMGYVNFKNKIVA